MTAEPIVKVNLAEAFASFSDHWSPRVAGTVNDFQVKVAKVRGSFIWHRHDEEDELFLVVRGTLRIRLRDGEIVLQPGEFVVIPRGVEHCPVAEEETHILLFERAGTVNTGNIRNERTVEAPAALRPTLAAQ